MTGMNFGRLFFDRKAITRRVDKATRRVLSRFGAFVRNTARKSIRRRKRPAEPGQPPSSHTGLLRRFIFFGYDPAPGRQSVVIGPERLTRRGRGEAPPLLEYGGSQRMKGRKGQPVRTTYQPRPFMAPAFQKELPNLPPLWRDSVKK